MYCLLNQVHCMVQTSAQEEVTLRRAQGMPLKFPVKKIYPIHPHAAGDNHFSGDPVLAHAGKMGFGMTCTTRKDRYPKGLRPYLHSEIIQKHDLQRSKVARYEQPIIAIKEFEATPSINGSAATKAFTQTHVSFQSTGPTNISGVNNLPLCMQYYTI